MTERINVTARPAGLGWMLREACPLCGRFHCFDGPGGIQPAPCVPGGVYFRLELDASEADARQAIAVQNLYKATRIRCPWCLAEHEYDEATETVQVGGEQRRAWRCPRSQGLIANLPSDPWAGTILSRESTARRHQELVEVDLPRALREQRRRQLEGQLHPMFETQQRALRGAAERKEFEGMSLEEKRDYYWRNRGGG